LFFNNKDSFKNVPDSLSKFIESSDIKGVKNLIQIKAVSIIALIEFIDYKFELALSRGEIKTSIVNIISLVLLLCTDPELGKKMRAQLASKSQFLGGVRSYLNSSEISEIIPDLKCDDLLLFIKETEELSSTLKSQVTHSIVSKGDNKILLMAFVNTFSDSEKELKTVSSSITSFMLSEANFLTEIKSMFKTPNKLYKILEPSLMDTFIEGVSNDITILDNTSKIDAISGFHAENGLSDVQIAKYFEKINTYIGSVNDVVVYPYWLDIILKFVDDIDDGALITRIITALTPKQAWLSQTYAGSWSAPEYQKTIYAHLGVVKGLYVASEIVAELNLTASWLNHFFSLNESNQLIQYINSLYRNIIDRHEAYSWPFSQNIINRFVEVTDWETKAKIASSINKMLFMTKISSGLNEGQITTTITNYLALISGEHSDEVVGWLSEGLKNKMLVELFRALIVGFSTEQKINIIDLLKNLDDSELIDGIVLQIIEETDCEKLNVVMEKFISANIGKDSIRRSIKAVLKDLGRESDKFRCFILHVALNEVSDGVIHNMLAEKIKHLIISEEEEEVLFALEVLKSLKITDTRKEKAIKALIQDIDVEKYREPLELLGERFKSS